MLSAAEAGEVAESTLFLVSTYTDNSILAHTPKGEHGQGVYAIQCSEDGKIALKAVSELGPNVAFLLKNPANDTVYATTECINTDGEILTTTLDRKTGKLKLRKRISAGGKSTCFLNLHKSGKILSAVNYWDAKLASFPISANGDVGQPLDINMQPGAEYVEQNQPTREEHWKFRQRWPHTHCMVTEPYTKQTEFVIDLGVDQVLQYQVHPTTGKLRKTGAVKLTPHLGPRHIIFHPHVKTAYLVNELQSSVSVFKYNPREASDEVVVEDSREKGSSLELIQTISTLPDDYDNNMSLNEHGVWKAASHSSEIRLHPSGKFLYIGNRGHDSIAVFSIANGSTGALKRVQCAKSGGKCPRNFNFSCTGRHMLVGNQDSNNCTLFEINSEKGTLTKISALPVPSPNYIYGLRDAQVLNSNEPLAHDDSLSSAASHAILLLVIFLWFVVYAYYNVGHKFDL
jgi:6-phosphogluconolactonase (cycloisomerase 2 family)